MVENIIMLGVWFNFILQSYWFYDSHYKNKKSKITADLIYAEINHGDAAHKEWLRNKLNSIFKKDK